MSLEHDMTMTTRTLLGGPAGAFVAPLAAAGKSETVTGELISVWCYIQSAKNVGEAGYVCALADLKWEGNPPGILTAAGKVYQLAGPAVGENNTKVVPLLGKTVSVTGDVVEAGGVRIITSNEVKVLSR